VDVAFDRIINGKVLNPIIALFCENKSNIIIIEIYKVLSVKPAADDNEDV